MIFLSLRPLRSSTIKIPSLYLSFNGEIAWLVDYPIPRDFYMELPFSCWFKWPFIFRSEQLLLLHNDSSHAYWLIVYTRWKQLASGSAAKHHRRKSRICLGLWNGPPLRFTHDEHKTSIRAFCYKAVPSDRWGHSNRLITNLIVICENKTRKLCNKKASLEVMVAFVFFHNLSRISAWRNGTQNCENVAVTIFLLRF